MFHPKKVSVSSAMLRLCGDPHGLLKSKNLLIFERGATWINVPAIIMAYTIAYHFTVLSASSNDVMMFRSQCGSIVCSTDFSNLKRFPSPHVLADQSSTTSNTTLGFASARLAGYRPAPSKRIISSSSRCCRDHSAASNSVVWAVLSA